MNDRLKNALQDLAKDHAEMVQTLKNLMVHPEIFKMIENGKRKIEQAVFRPTVPPGTRIYGMSPLTHMLHYAEGSVSISYDAAQEGTDRTVVSVFQPSAASVSAEEAIEGFRRAFSHTFGLPMLFDIHGPIDARFPICEVSDRLAIEYRCYLQDNGRAPEILIVPMEILEAHAEEFLTFKRECAPHIHILENRYDSNHSCIFFDGRPDKEPLRSMSERLNAHMMRDWMKHRNI